MSPWLGYIATFLITVVAATAVFFVWIANRKRIAAETIGRAEEQALKIIRDAEREIDTKKKEALLEAKEKAHDLVVAADRQAREQERQTS
jgi:ribonuclease Y